MSANELILYLNKVIEAGQGDKPIIIITPYDGHKLEIKSACFLECGVDTYQETSENLELITVYSYS